MGVGGEGAGSIFICGGGRGKGGRGRGWGWVLVFSQPSTQSLKASGEFEEKAVEGMEFQMQTEGAPESVRYFVFVFLVTFHSYKCI